MMRLADHHQTLPSRAQCRLEAMFSFSILGCAT